MDTKKIVNSLIEDITNDAAISHILLKAQIIAYNIGDEKLCKLIKCEQLGYSSNDEKPDYRKLKTMVKATFANNLGNIQIVTVPCEAIKDSRIQDVLNFVYLTEPLVHIENMYKNAESPMVKVQLPVFAYPTIISLYHCDGFSLHSAHHSFPKESLLTVVETFKAQLLDILLQFNDKLDWNIDISSAKNKNMAKTIINNVYHVNTVVANMGDGNVETQDINCSSQ